MAQDFRDAVRAQAKSFYKDIRARPAMFGSPEQIEAMWWVLLTFEAMALDPTPSDEDINHAKRVSGIVVANRYKWPGGLPFHVLARERADVDLIKVLSAWRVEFLRTISGRTSS